MYYALHSGKARSRVELSHGQSSKTSTSSRKKLNVQVSLSPYFLASVQALFVRAISYDFFTPLLKMLKVHEEMKAAGKRMKSLQESLTRNKGLVRVIKTIHVVNS